MTNSSSFTDAEMLVVANIVKDELAREILKVDENYFGFRNCRDLEANKRNYAFSSDMLGKMDYLEAKLDGTTWKKLKEYDLHQFGEPINETDILSAMSGLDPGFMIYGGEIYLLTDTAIINVTDGLAIYARVYPADITDLSSEIDMAVRPDDESDGFPRQFHELLARRIIIEYKSTQEKPIALSEQERNFENDLQKALDSLKNQNTDRKIIPSWPVDDGQSY